MRFQVNIENINAEKLIILFAKIKRYYNIYKLFFYKWVNMQVLLNYNINSDQIQILDNRHNT